MALVTGAAGGIGQAVTRTLADHGYLVVAADRHHPLTVPPGSEAIELDVADAEAVRAAVDHVERTLGPIEVLVHTAGVLHTGPVLDLDLDRWHDCLAVNATGVLLVSQAVGRRMAHRRRGSIVTVGSNAASTPRVHMAAYAASKAAATALTRVIGLELAAHGIRCNVVSPGSTDTAMWRSMAGPDDPIEASTIAGDPEHFRLGIPLARIATPDDIAHAVDFLVSDAARHITLHDLRVDGGATLDA